MFHTSLFKSSRKGINFCGEIIKNRFKRSLYGNKTKIWDSILSYGDVQIMNSWPNKRDDLILNYLTNKTLQNVGHEIFDVRM